MGTGLEILNDAGIIQVDSTFQNLSFVYTSSVLCNIGHLNCKTGYVNVTGKNPILGFQSGIGVTYIVTGKSGNVYTFRIYLDVDVDTTVTYWVFDSQDSSPAESFGLQVYNSSGLLCFDSSRKYLRVLQYFNGGTGNTFPGKSVIAFPCTFSYSVNWTPAANLLTWNYTFNMRFVKVTSSNVVEMYNILKGIGGGFSAPGASYSGRFSVIAADITNY